MTHGQVHGPPLSLPVQRALAILLLLVAATLPYSWLIEHFGYDDILREPTAVILSNFRRGGAPLVAAWFGFAMASLLFIPVAIGFQRMLAAHGVVDRGVAVLGIASAVVQAVGLLRWVLVVPALAATYADPGTAPATRETVLVVFDAVHRYGGMVLGEMVGQLLLAAWTGGIALQLWHTRALPRWLTTIGALTLPLWLLDRANGCSPCCPCCRASKSSPSPSWRGRPGSLRWPWRCWFAPGGNAQTEN